MYKIVKLVLNSGERLPCLVSEDSYLPLKVANRWAIRCRRYRVQSSTLESNLRDIKYIYLWAAQTFDTNLDDFILKGQVINTREINSLAEYLRNTTVGKDGRLISLSRFNNRLNVAKDFLIWSLDRGNRGGKSFLNQEEFYKTENTITRAFNLLYIAGKHSKRHEPLTSLEIEKIRNTIAPKKSETNSLIFPTCFRPNTRLRNYLMFEMALNLGLRKGELLKIRLDSLPRGNDDALKVLRFADDKSDTRGNEPNVKGAERLIPIPPFLRRLIKYYLTTISEEGRRVSHSPYLFLTNEGNPISIATTNDIIKAIGKISGVDQLCWHRLRHTWAENLADELTNQNRLTSNDSSIDVLQYLGGWKNAESPQIYIQNSIKKRALEILRKYQSRLYEE